MNLFPDDFYTVGRTSALGENIQSPRPANWQGNLIADVEAWFQTTPGANPNPDGAALLYYASAGYDQFIKDVAAVRAANPTAAAQIDQARAAAGLDTGKPPPVVQPPVVQPPVVIPPVVTPPPTPIIDCYPGYRQVGDKCVPIPGWVPPPPKPVFGGPIYSNASGVANAILVGYLSDDPAHGTFTVNVGEKVPDNFVLVSASSPKPDKPIKEPITAFSALTPIYTKQFPYPTATRDMVGFLFGQDELDMPIIQKFNLKKGDPIPVNWNEDVAFKVPEDMTPIRPTAAAGGVGTLILAAAAAYLLGS